MSEEAQTKWFLRYNFTTRESNKYVTVAWKKCQVYLQASAEIATKRSAEGICTIKISVGFLCPWDMETSWAKKALLQQVSVKQE